jgi:2-methylisocitrate lyase-like PEP mutase family enzyme
LDADSVFGGSENFARTFHEIEAAGLAGCHI